ncbi:MAG: aminotransferase class V-fold PLP-dependent enzyme [Microthrixaceae bacterium]|nr:aminotransferase class V-fold PLP-dependent enzyme [Microthrixaceae bacterium]
MEGEVIGMARSLFGANAGSLSAGGTESIFLAVQTARDHAHARGVMSPELVCARTVHPAFAKACKYLDVTQRFTEVTDDGRADPEAMEAALNADTALLVASAPGYPFGVIDPVTDIAAMAAERDLLCHVDACLGGWLLPFWERLGEEVVPWDFRVEGVTSLSADIHKYGYCFKGISTITYRDPELYQRQVFMYDQWPGGLYASASAAGTRPGPPIAGAWATITHLGADGYMRLGARVLEATQGFLAAVDSVDGVRATPTPDMSVFQIGVDADSEVVVDIEAVGDRMDERGWNMDRQQGGLHVMLSPGHDKVATAFGEDLAASVADQGVPLECSTPTVGWSTTRRCRGGWRNEWSFGGPTAPFFDGAGEEPARFVLRQVDDDRFVVEELVLYDDGVISMSLPRREGGAHRPGLDPVLHGVVRTGQRAAHPRSTRARHDVGGDQGGGAIR